MLEYDYYLSDTYPLSFHNDTSYSFLLKNDNISQLKSLNDVTLDYAFRYASLQDARIAVARGDQFAFFSVDFDLRTFQQDIVITSRLNDYFNYSNHEEASKQIRNSVNSIVELNEESKNALANFVSSFSFMVTEFYDTTDFEVLVRTEPAYDKENQCAKWHIDKTDQEIHDLFSGKTKSHYHAKQKIILPLFGDPTLFWNTSITQHEDFLNSSEDKVYFYGFNKSCEINNRFSVRVNQEQVFQTPVKYGSVHLAGINGTIHSTPVSSEHGRILIMISIL